MAFAKILLGRGVSTFFALCFGWLSIGVLQAAEVPLTLLHTNDLHSHYKQDIGPVSLGGIARMATKIRQIRNSVENSLLVDGGDWSEGHIYYNLDAGRTSIEIMNVLGYDAAVVGNHDFLNGPEQMLSLFKHTQPRPVILCANLDLKEFIKKNPAAAQEFMRYVLPYKVFKVGGAKVAMIGVTTKELVYDDFFNPVEIDVPIGVVRELATKLKKEADLVIVLSHNSYKPNLAIASLANVDIVVHSHDHEKYAKPIVVQKDASEISNSVANPQSALMIEAGDWGYYLGKLDILIDTKTKNFRMAPGEKAYELIQIDSSIPEDPDVATMIANYDKQLVQKYGNILDDKIVDSKIAVKREGSEPLLGNLIADAYRSYTKADVAFESTDLTSMELYKGPLSTVDFYNAITVIYNPDLDHAWTLKTMNMTGDTLDWVVNYMLMIKGFFDYSLPNVSGLQVVYNPLSEKKIPIYGDSKSSRPLVKMEVGGKPLDLKKEYLVAVPTGIYEAITWVEKKLGNSIPRSNEKDTGVEQWRILKDYVAKNGSIDTGLIPRGNRFIVLQPDVGIYNDDIRVKRSRGMVAIEIRATNFGSAKSGPRTVEVTYDQTPRYYGDDPNRSAVKAEALIPAMSPGESKSVATSLALPEEFDGDKMRLYFKMPSAKEDPNSSNESTWVPLEPL